ncbi:hypothetical protein [Pleomorphomonas koreensis]|uniref:hypothetical protein n=1 Tax=Pleomorphomonas koreensis TaxID=257440 RepID=UPI000418B58C|nr:hypothetical protein [Pleomorphomonas koreensis]
MEVSAKPASTNLVPAASNLVSLPRRKVSSDVKDLIDGLVRGCDPQNAHAKPATVDLDETVAIEGGAYLSAEFSLTWSSFHGYGRGFQVNDQSDAVSLAKAAAEEHLKDGFWDRAAEKALKVGAAGLTKKPDSILCEKVSGAWQKSETCGRCRGDGRLNCSYCDWAGKVRCNVCAGSGRYRDGMGEYHGCSTCGSTGRVTCWTCFGTTKVDCSSCSGTGATTDSLSISVTAKAIWLAEGEPRLVAALETGDMEAVGLLDGLPEKRMTRGQALFVGRGGDVQVGNITIELESDKQDKVRGYLGGSASLFFPAPETFLDNVLTGTIADDFGKEPAETIAAMRRTPFTNVVLDKICEAPKTKLEDLFRFTYADHRGFLSLEGVRMASAWVTTLMDALGGAVARQTWIIGTSLSAAAVVGGMIYLRIIGIPLRWHPVFGVLSGAAIGWVVTGMISFTARLRSKKVMSELLPVNSGVPNQGKLAAWMKPGIPIVAAIFLGLALYTPH